MQVTASARYVKRKVYAKARCNARLPSVVRSPVEEVVDVRPRARQALS